MNNTCRIYIVIHCESELLIRPRRLLFTSSLNIGRLFYVHILRYLIEQDKLCSVEHGVCVSNFLHIPNFRYHGNKGFVVNFNKTIRFSDHDFLKRVEYYGDQKSFV